MKKSVDSSFSETSEVRITLDSYEDIFSDFDPRPYSEKGLSGDFLNETKRATMAKHSDKINLIMFVPKEKRNLKQETVIKKRLSEHFRHLHTISKKEKRGILKKGIIFCLVGIALMLTATYLYFKFKDESLAASFFTILLEPASWFLFWEGLDLVIFDSKEVNNDLKFYKAMSNAEMKFLPS